MLACTGSGGRENLLVGKLEGMSLAMNHRISSCVSILESAASEDPSNCLFPWLYEDGKPRPGLSMQFVPSDSLLQTCRRATASTDRSLSSCTEVRDTR